MRTAILFPGQGSQEKNMGRDLAEAKPSIMELWDLAEKQSGLPLREIYWTGEDTDMADTKALQPALTVAGLSVWLMAKDKLRPEATAGHSLGEFSSLAASGVLSVEQAIRAVALRGQLMAQGSEGQGMAAVVKLGLNEVEEIVVQARKDTGAELLIANYNSPAQFVISGQTPALERAGELVKEQRGRAIPLAVSRAFHSPLNNEAAAEFEAFLRTLDWKKPAFPVYFDATATPETKPELILEVMCRQMTSSVYWLQIMENMFNHGLRRFIELGPKGVLAKLAAMNLKEMGEIESLGVSTLEQIQAL